MLIPTDVWVTVNEDGPAEEKVYMLDLQNLTLDPHRNMGDVILTVRDLRKVLTSDTYQFELSIPRLALERGRFYGLVGKSGSGKSTMLDLLAMVSLVTKLKKFEICTGRRRHRPGRIAQVAARRQDIGSTACGTSAMCSSPGGSSLS